MLTLEEAEGLIERVREAVVNHERAPSSTAKKCEAEELMLFVLENAARAISGMPELPLCPLCGQHLDDGKPC
jgi:DNA repair exonuclease SbcCD ATPase subunit